MQKTLYTILIALISLSCTTYKWLSEDPGKVTVEELQQAPQSVYIDDRRMFLKTEMWRDFMPTADLEGQPPSTSGSPLIAIIAVSAVDSAKLSSLIELDELWIINGNEIWNTKLGEVDHRSSLSKSNAIVKVARNGPKWNTEIRVEVIVSLRDSHGKIKLLRAPDQWIGRTE